MTNPKNNITVIDGDGALLMRMGSMSSLGFYRPGGQPTASSDVDYAAIAAACSYPVVMKVSSADELKNALTECRNLNRLSFIYMPIVAASKEGLGRPTVKPRDILLLGDCNPLSLYRELCKKDFAYADILKEEHRLTNLYLHALKDGAGFVRTPTRTAPKAIGVA
ncbi:hypothetical protein CHS0354_006903 [Potamilus streckersoni]|uniref:Uncharacterized protein n=1 Tax=Potamilus streckersoni TaxID=2493646 RepID=A0AAE0TED5_9BIVA|nr:hypothetical protein CHS0354_006903 [Potamilus streckersoni]